MNLTAAPCCAVGEAACALTASLTVVTVSNSKVCIEPFLSGVPFAARLHRGQNVGVGPATADVPAERLLDVLIARSARFMQHGGSGHNLTTGTVTALIAVVFHKCGLNRMHLFGRAKALDGRNFCTLLHRCKEQAAIRTTAVDMYRARAALAVITTLLGASQMKRLTQSVEERGARVDPDSMRCAIYFQRDRYSPGDGSRL